MNSILIVNAKVINEGTITEQDILVKGQRIEQIGTNLSGKEAKTVIDADGKWLIPGIIDDQVHFREPGLTHKATIYSESRAAVAGGITSFMEMPNTVPNTTTQALLAEKYAIASMNSLANYSFYMGATNTNLEEILKTDKQNVCGVKIFMGSSTGDMLVDDQKTLEAIFSRVDMLIATHCEDEATIRANSETYRKQYGENIPFPMHPEIRSREACLLSSSRAVEMAKKYDTRLHVLHISTKDELALFDNSISLKNKRITAEACIHHLWFDSDDYAQKQSWIKWNPAIKLKSDKEAILTGVLNDTIDVIATDHAPHTIEEKLNSYFKAPSGGPLVQHSLVAAIELHKQSKISMEKLVEKMCHAPAMLFDVKKRGFVREGYFADLVLVDPDKKWKVDKSNILYKCGWSPFEEQVFQSQVTHTLVSGHLAYENGRLNDAQKGMRLAFDRR